MNKGDLIDKVARDAGVTKTAANAAIDSLVNGITSALKRGQRVTLVGFGTFEVRHRKARKGINPQTGNEMQIPAKNVAKFKPGKNLKEALER